MSEPTLHTMPSGASCVYRDSDHAYFERLNPDGSCSGRIPGISTIAKNCGDTNNDGLLDWAARLTCEGIAREASLGLSLEDVEDMRHALSWQTSAEAIGQTLRDEKLTWRDLRNEAGTRGSISHDVLEHLAEGRTPLPVSGYDRSVIEWWRWANPTPVCVEQVVYSPTHGFAGRFDLLATVHGQNVLLDLKTSKYVSNAFAVQLNLYALAAEESGFPPVDALAILQASEAGVWSHIPIPKRPAWALAALQTYKHGKEIGREIRAAKNAPGPVAA